MTTIINKLLCGIQYAALFIFLLTGCSVDDAPPVKEKKTIRNSVTSMAALGEIRTAKLSAYEVAEDCSRLRLIDSQSYDGNFNLTLDLDRGTVLYKLTRAKYIEEASQQEVLMTEGQWLGAVVSYDVNEPQQEVAISPWSHLQTGLFCWELRKGNPIEALDKAHQFIYSMLDFDPRYSGMRLPTKTANNRLDVPFDDGMKLGFMNAALSQFSLKVSRQLETDEHLGINSVYTAQLFYQDIYDDGALDGRGIRGRLRIIGDKGVYPITLATYRTELPLELLAFYDGNDLNQITRGRGILYSMAAGMNENQHPVLYDEGARHIPLDQEPPEASWLSERQLVGWVNISLQLEDLTAVDRESLRFYGLEGLIEPRGNGLFVVQINTKPDGSGLRNYRLFVSDVLGNNRTYDFAVELINDPPSINVDSPDHSIERQYELVASYGLVSPSQQIAGGECALNQIVFPLVIESDKNRVHCAILFSANGDKLIEVRLCDTYGHCSTKTHRVVYDNQPPEIKLIEHQALYQQNISLAFSVEDRTTGVEGPVRWKMSANGQALSGEASWINGSYSIFVDGARFGNNLVKLTINATDQLGNIALFSRSFRVANQPATIKVTSSPWIRDNFHSLVFTINENSFTNAKPSCRIENRTGFILPVTYEAGIGECLFALPSLEDGIYQATIRICGDYALCATHSTRLIKDTRGPAITVSGLEEDSMDGRIEVNVSVSDDYGRVVWQSYQLDGRAERQLGERLSLAGLATGSHHLIIRARDEIGNEAQERYEFLVRKDEPILALMSNRSVRDSVYSLRAHIDPASYEGLYSVWCELEGERVSARIGSNYLFSCDLDLTALSDGDYEVKIRLLADYGINYERKVEIVKDTSAPIIDMSLIKNEFHSGAIPLAIGIEDIHSSIQSATYSLNNGQAIPLTSYTNNWGFILAVDELATGRHSLTIEAADELGNKATEIKRFLVLRDEPTLVRTSPSLTKEQEYSLIAQLNSHSYEGDYTGHCQLDSQRVSASIDNGILSCSLDLTNLADGNWTINIDLTPDYDRPYPRQLSIVKDTTPPEIEFLNLADSYVNGTFALDIRMLDVHSGVKTATYRLDNGIEKPLTKRGGDEWGFILAVAELATGRHSISVRAGDRANNERLITTDFLILKDEPQLSLLSPSSIKENGYSLRARIDPASYEGLYTGWCELGGVKVPAQIGSNYLFNCVLDLTNLLDGSYEIGIELLADYGIRYEREVRIVKDANPPTIDMRAVAAEFESGAIPLFIGIEDLHSSIRSVTYSLDGGQAIPLTPYTNNWGFILAVDELATGRHSLTILAMDELGNRATKTRSFLVLKDEPSLVRTSPLLTRDQAYSLTAALDSHSYEGRYQGYCQLGLWRAVALIENGILSCLLHLNDSADGNQTINIGLMADYGRSYQRQLSIVKDTNPPEIEFTNLAASYVNGTFPLNIRIVDGHSGIDAYSGIKAASYRLDNGAEKPLTRRGGDEWGFILAVDELATGRHSISVRVRDKINNERILTVPFLVLKDEPQLNLLSAGSTKEDGYSLRAEIDSASYEGSYSGWCSLGARKVPAQINSDTGLLTCDLDLTSIRDGSYEIGIELIADYGSHYEREVRIVKDTSPPIIDMRSIASEFESGAIPLSVSIADLHSPIKSATYSLDGGQAMPLTPQAQGWGFTLAVDELATGRHSLTIVAIDELDNQASQTRSFLVLKDAPFLVRTSPFFTKQQAYSLTASLDSHSYEGSYQGHCQLGLRRVLALIENDLLSCSLDLTDLADGNQTINIELVANYGRSYQRQLRIVKDATPPEIEFANLAASYVNGTFALNIRIVDGHSGIKQASYRLDNGAEKPLTRRGGDEWGFILAVDELATGRHSISVRAKDRANNERLMAVPFLVLKDEPQLSLLSASSTKDNGYSLRAEIDPASYEGGYSGWCNLGARKVPAQISSNTGLLTCDLDLTTVRDGDYAIGVELIADYGTLYEREVRIVKDTSPPSIDMRAIDDEFESGAIPLSIGIADLHSSIQSATYSLDGGQAIPLTPYTNNWGFILAVDGLATGRHRLTIIATDDLGNQATEMREFLVLKDEPSLMRTSSFRTKHQAYSLTAQVDSHSYEGDYTGHCRLGSQRVLALIENSLLSCPLDLTNLADGNWTINIDLRADYGRSYQRQLNLVKDTTPPQISAYNHLRVYTSSPARLEFKVVDALSPVESLFYSYGSSAGYQAARYLGNNYWTLDMELATNGEHSLRLIARDILGHQRQRDWQLLLVKDAPQLDFTHPSLSRETTMDISGNITLATHLAPVDYVDCLVPNGSAIRARITTNQFVCRGYNIEDYDENPIDVRVCDTYQNCAVFQTYVSQDGRSPLVTEVFPAELLSYDLACLEDSDYNNISVGCPIEMQTGVLQSAESAASPLNPRPYILYQNATRLNERELSDQAAMDADGIAYVLITAKDRSDPRFYFSRPQDLNISYSYTQLNCLVDDEVRCPTSRRTRYFANRPLEPWSYQNSEAKATIAFTNEFLNQAGRPLWYLAPTSYIHRLDILICDEAKNCVTRIVRFRTKLFASEPIVKARVSDNFIRLLRQSSNYAQVLGSSASVARQWEIINPSDYPIWVRVSSPEDITIRYDRIYIRKKNLYRKHKVREFVHGSYLPGDASCGRTPWYTGNKRREKYRIYQQYLSENWVYTYDDPNGERGGAYGTHNYQFKVRESCSRVTDRIIQSRYEIASGYPRLVTQDSVFDEHHSFIHSLNYYSVNDRGELIPAYPESDFYRIGARAKLIVQTDERLRGTPPYWSDRQAVYGDWKNLDNQRIISIPLALDLSYVPSSFSDENRAQPATYSLRYATDAAGLAKQTFRRRLPLYCAETCFRQRTSDSWEQIAN